MAVELLERVGEEQITVGAQYDLLGHAALAAISDLSKPRIVNGNLVDAVTYGLVPGTELFLANNTTRDMVDVEVGLGDKKDLHTSLLHVTALRERDGDQITAIQAEENKYMLRRTALHRVSGFLGELALPDGTTEFPRNPNLYTGRYIDDVEGRERVVFDLIADGIKNNIAAITKKIPGTPRLRSV